MPKRLGYPTSKGFAAAGVTEPKYKGRGSIGHRHMAVWIKESCQETASDVHMEYILPNTNHPVDVGAIVGTSIEAYECIVTCTSNVSEAIEHCFEACTQVSQLTFVCTNKKSSKALEKKLTNDPVFQKHKARIAFKTINDFYQAKE